MKNDKGNEQGSIIIGLLGILFVGLKLGGVIDWSWWLVLLPFYGGISLALVFILILLIANALKRK